jgi:two-component system LytT family response regulator
MDMKKTNYNILSLRTSRGVEAIDINTIMRIEAIGNYSKIYFGEPDGFPAAPAKTLVTAKILQWFENMLCTLEAPGQAGTFVRVHRTHLVNKKFIQYYIKGNIGKVQLVNGERIDVSRRKKGIFLQYWNKAA